MLHTCAPFVVEKILSIAKNLGDKPHRDPLVSKVRVLLRDETFEKEERDEHDAYEGWS